MVVPDSLIPLVDLQAQHESLRYGIKSAISECISQSQFRRGPCHDLFAEEFAELYEVETKVIEVRGETNV